MKSEDVARLEAKSTIEVCPLCGSPLEKGYIASKMVV